MRRARMGMAVAVAVVAGLLLPAGAWAVRDGAASTTVRSVKVFKVGDRVHVDVAVSHPDAKARSARKLSRKARNRGLARITLRGADGAVLTTDQARASLPVDVPRANAVVQTYRFTLSGPVGQQVAAAATVNVQVDVETRLDLDGSGPDDATTDADTTTVDVPVDAVDSVPPLQHYVDVHFGTGAFCNIENDDCGVYFDFRSLPGPFHDETGRVKITPAGGQTNLRFGTSTQFLEGNVPNMASNRFEITNGVVVPWGIGKITSAGRTAGTPGTVGGPLALDVESEKPFGSHDWHVWGYVNIAVSQD